MSDTFHYTNKVGFNGIRAQPDWIFQAQDPPKSSNRPRGAYFTTLCPCDNNIASLCKRLRIPREKREFVFSFHRNSKLIHLNDARGRDEYILYSKEDYIVENKNQGPYGPTEEVKDKF